MLALGSTVHLEHLSYRAWPRTYGKSVQFCAPGIFVERLSRLAAFAGGTIVSINAWRARLSQTCHCGRVRRKRAPSAGTLSPAAPVPSGISSPRIWPLRSSRDVPAGRWIRRGKPGRGGSPPVPPAYEQAISNQPAWGRRLPAALGRPPADPSETWVGGWKGCAVDSLER